LSFSLIKHYLQYITHKILHSIRPWNASSSASQEV
jgi:hypothetical protein